MTPHPQRCETCKNVTDSTVRIGYKKCKLSGMLLNSNFDMFEHSSITGCASHSSRPHTCNIMTCEKAIDACLDSRPHTPAAPINYEYCKTCGYWMAWGRVEATIRNETLNNLDWGDIIRAIERRGYTVKIRKQDVAIIRSTNPREQSP